jgi:nucleoside-diphosphate-sugar epimerase
MNIFLTGGAGYIGSVATRALLDADHTVTVLEKSGLLRGI